MKIPNPQNAIIEQAKIEQYLLDVDHPQGGTKARLLLSLGYSVDNWRILDDDLRRMHVPEDVLTVRSTEWGIRYEIVAPLTGPNGDIVLMRSIWQIDVGAEAPRLITMYPE
jgi:hypothetical protein